MLKRAIAFWQDRTGAAAAEFAIVVLVFMSMILAIVWLSMAIYANTQLRQASQAAARCGVVRSWSTSCNTATAIHNFAVASYRGPGTPTFDTPVKGSCGTNSWTVVGHVQVPLPAALVNTQLNMSSRACFPG
jgi:Flp pilus assembly protein TadG